MEWTMIDRVGTVSVFVADQDRAKEFYTNVLGFELRADNELYPGALARWVAVAPAGAETEVILYLPDENWEHYKHVVGKSQPLTFNWGTFAIIQDSEGNHLIIVEQPKG
jgi:catechol 2,3-dioxygenase-like lactoylglutathione lyase family enzyme